MLLAPRRNTRGGRAAFRRSGQVAARVPRRDAEMVRRNAIQERERLGEAQRMQWLGEVAGLEKSLRHIANKKQQAEHLRVQAD